MTTGRLQEAIVAIQQTSNEIIETSRALPEETIRWKPSETAWSVIEVLAHVEESLFYWPKELKAVVDKPGIEWGRGLQDPSRLAAPPRAADRSLGDILEGIARATQQGVGILGQLRDQDLLIESPSRNPRFAVKPMSFIVDHMLVEHLQKHLRQIQRNATQFTEGQRMQSEAR